MIYSYTFFIVFGLAVGSFLNVVIFRYLTDRVFSLRAVSGRSKCLSCLRQLKWYELIPLFSFVVQGGRCRNCKTTISWQYFLVEAASGLIFLLPFYFYNQLTPVNYFVISSAVWILIFLIFLLVWAIDARLYIIPDGLNIVLGILGIILIAAEDKYQQFSGFAGSFLGNYASLFQFRENIWFNHLGAALLGVLIVGLIILFTRGKGMGMGDLKLMGVLGLIFGWPDIVFILAFACIIGSIFSIYWLLAGKKDMKTAIPFAPFLILGALTVTFFGKIILDAYFGLFNFF